MNVKRSSWINSMITTCAHAIPFAPRNSLSAFYTVTYTSYSHFLCYIIYVTSFMVALHDTMNGTEIIWITWIHPRYNFPITWSNLEARFSLHTRSVLPFYVKTIKTIVIHDSKPRISTHYEKRVLTHGYSLVHDECLSPPTAWPHKCFSAIALPPHCNLKAKVKPPPTWHLFAACICSRKTLATIAWGDRLCSWNCRFPICITAIHLTYAIWTNPVNFFLVVMTSHIVLPRSLRIAEVFTVLLGLGLSTIAIGARIYMKLRVSRQFHSEDCKIVAIGSASELC